ncbi:2,3-bisphosphoglycerate-independent phosphoglycerate mutase [Hahella chejuensis KCTC 2396]|uniref:2,3-bisphosphoglycerate-independent phosphoglycerate mutase n=1 Tax=Hahella chejuensis (strain KCTC 2396) TaxID=349521 RepID=GPMI_HAHCH|nr:2,3-bisphosphoglycerate-independent phosphoglycerate mutase [Hahella chejuensis]Q2SMA7.1 RecName: Full=2,3-bisphosphoglycerate-independent phosphoglycerate mutase; Short=BPG-independent PGAM; Short=Phosphoglyceromutase; Short=iPGM [Hahella chejuensis KCTC 2396]ABC28217.1 2,3-bisphosphoglycerate-independent phosphoglycerate mutase [Hahella chejuensis KCTC 2396]
MTAKRKPTALLILDGWGYREGKDSNAIANANTPFWDQISSQNPHVLIHTSGMAVGLPEGQMGNSEVGHMNLGAGRIVYQNFTRITKDIEDGVFAQNPAISSAIDKAVSNGKAVHLLGLLSPGGVHSHEDHILAACKVARERGADKVFVHAFLDGRDTPPRSAQPSLERTDKLLKELGCGRVASIIGRYYAMDRDNRWDRVQAAYDLLTLGEAPYHAESAVQALTAAYERGEDDEFVKATLIKGSSDNDAVISDGDAVIFMNFRADRARELTRCFVEQDFDGFQRNKLPKLADFVMLTEYSANIHTACAYPATELTNSIGEYMATLHKTQLRIAETEKYAHVTFFFSGGKEALFEGEERILIPSPDVATYDLKPEMSAPEVTDKLVEAIKSGKFDLIVCNYANGDMVGHSGVYDAAMKAAECIDQCLKRIAEALNEVGGQCLITADHGNAEQMVDENGQPHTQHTTGPVPLIYIGPKNISLKEDGRLCDIAPSLLDLMELEKPREMTGESLIVQN